MVIYSLICCSFFTPRSSTGVIGVVLHAKKRKYKVFCAISVANINCISYMVYNAVKATGMNLTLWSISYDKTCAREMSHLHQQCWGHTPVIKTWLTCSLSRCVGSFMLPCIFRCITRHLLSFLQCFLLFGSSRSCMSQNVLPQVCRLVWGRSSFP